MTTYLISLLVILFIVVMVFYVRLLIVNERVYRIRDKWIDNEDPRWFKYEYNKMIGMFAYKIRLPKDEDF